MMLLSELHLQLRAPGPYRRRGSWVDMLSTVAPIFFDIGSHTGAPIKSLTEAFKEEVHRGPDKDPFRKGSTTTSGRGQPPLREAVPYPFRKGRLPPPEGDTSRASLWCLPTSASQFWQTYSARQKKSCLYWLKILICVQKKSCKNGTRRVQENTPSFWNQIDLAVTIFDKYRL